MKLLKPFILLFIFLPLLITCKRDVPLYEIHNLNGDKISCYGNGGMGIQFEYPINTYESIEPCLRIGADGTELDVQMTKDSVLVAFHDSNLNESTTCDDTINDHLWSEISGCIHVSPITSSAKIISLNEIYDRLDVAGKYTYTFDCKPYTNTTNMNAFRNQFANAIVNFKTSHHLADDQVFIESQDSTFLRVLKNKDANMRLFIYPDSFDQGLQIAEAMNIYGITIDNQEATTEQISFAHKKGFRVTLWGTKKDKENLDAVYKSPDFIQSDNIIYLLKIFGKYKK
jgi:glycerophosphoryl diester phosphodiesterase